MHDPVQITILEEQKLWGMLPKELAFNAAGVSSLLGLGFVAVSLLTHEWWFLVGTGLAGVNAAALQALSTHLRNLACANADLADDET